MQIDYFRERCMMFWRCVAVKALPRSLSHLLRLGRIKSSRWEMSRAYSLIQIKSFGCGIESGDPGYGRSDEAEALARKVVYIDHLVTSTWRA